MTLLAIHGFDHESSLLDHWFKSSSSLSYSIDYAVFRTGIGSLRISGGSVYTLIKKIPVRSTYIVGAAVFITQFPAATPNYIFDFNGSTLGINPAGNLVYARNTVVQATSVGSLLINTWYYIEMKIFMDNAVGTIEVHVDGAPFLTYNGDTIHGGFSMYGRLGLGGSATGNHYYDDLYLCDTNGAVNNDFLGDCIVTTLIPTGPGDLAQFTPSAGANWENVDESPPNDDVNYNDGSGTALPRSDLFQLQNITPPVGQIAGVMGVKASLYGKNSSWGNISMRTCVKIGGSVYTSDAYGLGQNYYFHENYWENSPASGAAWTQSEINNAQLGYRREV